ncbi:L,D-transpeptidase [Thiocystis violascens]|nr:L,D-transpeptidase [Thiocystis violascens]
MTAPDGSGNAFGHEGERTSDESKERTNEELPVDGPDQRSEETQSRALTINLKTQQFSYLVDGEAVRSGPISSGAQGYPTPTGTFSVLGKEKDKVSSRYTNTLGMQAWMPYSIRFHGHYFLHEGWLPGYPDSHGCVRLGEKDARFLFERMKIGDRVEVVN